MSDKPPSPKFAQTIPTGIVAMICGIGALASLSQNLFSACLLGISGLVIGIATLKTHAEELDKISAMIGMILSLTPMIYAIVILIKK